jgi:hypothetical protein
MITEVAVNIPFPAGFAVADLAGGTLVGVVLATTGLPRAELSISVTFRAVRGLVLNIGNGEYVPVPLEFRNLPSDIEVVVANAGVGCDVILYVDTPAAP